EQAGEPFLGRIEELVDQVFFDTGAPCQNMGYKHLREFGLTAKNPTHFQDFHSHRYTFSHRSCGCQPPRLSNQASFSEEFVRTQERDDGLLSLLGHYGDFDLAFFDVEDCISGIALRKEFVSRQHTKSRP